MTEASNSHVLGVIVCGAGPASEVGQLVDLAQGRGWGVQVVATPAALSFIDVNDLERKTGRPVRSQYRRPGESRSPRADGIIVAPATYNTINKWALGISDTYALGLLAEAPGLNIPIAVLPFVNTALAVRQAFQRSLENLRQEGIHILVGPKGIEPHAPGTGGDHIETFPWTAALNSVEQAVTRR